MDTGSLSELELVILLAVMRCEPSAYGVAVQRDLHETIDRDISIGTIYKTLNRLGRRGLVESRRGESTPVRGGRAKTYYTVSGEGRLAARGSLRMLDTLRAPLGPDWSPA